MTTTPKSKYSIKLPSGLQATIEAPTDLESDLIELSLTAYLGGLTALAKCNSQEIKRDFLIRYVASILNSAHIAVRSIQIANQVSDENHSKIIDDLLKSLH